MQITNLHIAALGHAVNMFRELALGHAVKPEGPSEDAATSKSALAELMVILQSEEEPGVGDLSVGLTPQQMLDMRLKAIEVGTKMAEAKGKAGHAVYIAADLYGFLMTGKKPVIPTKEVPVKD